MVVIVVVIMHGHMVVVIVEMMIAQKHSCKISFHCGHLPPRAAPLVGHAPLVWWS